jgi:hypothetical protein
LFNSKNEVVVGGAQPAALAGLVCAV